MCGEGWGILCGEICDNPRFVFNIVIITYIPASN